MSKYAVVLLLFFILVTIFLEPIITRSLSLNAQDVLVSKQAEVSSSAIFNGDSVLNTSYLPAKKAALKGATGIIEPLIMRTVITAYSSSPDETKPENPYITASGNYVSHGVAAANFLPIGTKIRIPKLFPGRVFIVEDRMNKRYNDRIDIWMPSKESALNFGLKVSDIEIF